MAGMQNPLVGIAAGAACLVVERQTFHLSEPITSVQMPHPGDRFQIVGDFALSGFENTTAGDKG